MLVELAPLAPLPCSDPRLPASRLTQLGSLGTIGVVGDGVECPAEEAVRRRVLRGDGREDEVVEMECDPF